MIRGSSAGPPDDARPGRPGWSAGGRRRPDPAHPPDADNAPTGQVPRQDPPRQQPPRQQPPRQQPPRQQPPPYGSQPPPPRRQAPEWHTPPPRQRRPTYGTDGYPREQRHESVAADAHGYDDRYEDAPRTPRPPKKITVTRVVAYRSRQIGQQAVGAFRKAARADGAHESGLTSLTYAVMLNYASSAAMAIGLANTLFFSAATAESKTKVALYLLITIAPFALIAPVVGPMLDRVQRGRRIALAISCVGQGLLSVVMALHLNDWLLYPAALGTLVLSKSFDVLKSSLTPRVLPDGITLSKTNARLTIFGLGAGIVFGALASGFAKLFGSPGALWFTAVLCIADAVLCLGIPAWVEVTEGEVPASLRAQEPIEQPTRKIKQQRQPMGRHVVIGLWGNGSIRFLTGFLLLFPAFVIKSMEEHSPTKQLLLLGLIGAAAGIGSFAGNFIGARLQFGKPDQIILACIVGCVAGSVLAALAASVTMTAIAALVASVASALAKISLDATIQHDLPEASRASAFGRSETILQLTWVFGGALGVLLPTDFLVGFTVVSAILALGLVQTVLLQRDRSMLPDLRGWRPNVSLPRRRRTVDPSEAPTKTATKAMPTERAEYR